MITFVAEVQYPKGLGVICAVSFQPIFRNESTVDLEITFLATRLNAEGSGMAIWLLHQVIINFTVYCLTSRNNFNFCIVNFANRLLWL